VPHLPRVPRPPMTGLTREQLFLDERPKILSYLVSRGMSVWDAEDAVSQALTDIPCPCSPALLWRAAMRDAGHLQARRYQQDVRIEDTQPDGDRWIKERIMLQGAIDRLPPAWRESFILVHIRGLTVREAAGTLNRSKSTVARQVHNATTRLKEALA
jgi:RNA polymerase sigma factor (sigma-70 family)